MFVVVALICFRWGGFINVAYGCCCCVAGVGAWGCFCFDYWLGIDVATACCLIWFDWSVLGLVRVVGFSCWLDVAFIWLFVG